MPPFPEVVEDAVVATETEEEESSVIAQAEELETKETLYTLQDEVPIDPLDESLLGTIHETLQEDARTLQTGSDSDTLDDFLKDLFDDESPDGSTGDSTSHEDAQPPQPEYTPPTEEELAERKQRLAIETAEKRVDITARHTQWEEKLEAAGTDEIGKLITTLLELRNQEAQRVKTNKDIVEAVSELEREGFKAIKGVEAFLVKKLVPHAKEEKTDESIKKKWENIVDKVEQKISDKKTALETDLEAYYTAYLEDELEHVGLEYCAPTVTLIIVFSLMRFRQGGHFREWRHLQTRLNLI